MLLTTVFDGQACYLCLSRSLAKILLREKSSFVHWTVFVVGYLVLEANAAGDQNFTKDLKCPECCDLALCFSEARYSAVPYACMTPFT